MAREKVLYSNYWEDLMSEEEAREILEEMGHENISEEDIYCLINEQNDLAWSDFINEFEKYLLDKWYIATGTCGLWNGEVKGGKVIPGINTFLNLLIDCNYVKISDIDGRLMIKCSHHDGTNYYELRELNDRGLDFYVKKEDITYKEMCETLFKKYYSKRPNIFKKIYGC